MVTARVARLAGAFPVVAVSLGAAHFMLTAWSPPERRESVSYLVLVSLLLLAWASVGALIVARRPRHPVGWLLGGGAIFGLMGVVGDVYASLEPALPGGDWVWWVTGWFEPLAIGAIPLLLLVFPDGRLLSRRWRSAVWLTLLAVALLAVGAAVSPSPGQPWIENPTGLEVSEDHALYGGGVGWLVLFAAQAAAVTSFFVRFHRSGTEQRRQLKWLLWAVVLVAIGFVASTFFTYGASPAVEELAVSLTLVSLLFLPVAIGIAILRHRVFDIDLLIRRSVVYAVVWLLVGAAYVGVAALPGTVVGRRALPVEVAVALTIAATLAFQPARRAVDRVVGRLLFGERPSELELLTGFSEAVADTFDVVELAPRIADTVRRGLDLDWARVLLDLGGTAGDLPWPAGAAGIALDDGVRPVLAVPLVNAGAQVGVIECGPKRDGRFAERDQQLLASLARQAALGIGNARLAAELSARLGEIHRQAEELAASRARIVAAADSERQRIERDLHDGVQQEVISLVARLGLARAQLRRDPAVAEATLADLAAQSSQVLTDLRELVQGIHPPVLTDRGLLEAVEARLARVPIGVQIVADAALRGTRFPPDVEAAAYFFVSEGLTNTIKHAGASRAAIRLAADDDRLSVEVEDDGVGFVPAEAAGSGLTGLRDRVEALGGRVRVVSRPGHGCRLVATLPAGQHRQAKEGAR